VEQQEISLVGKIAASMTHEMKNVLAIIKESNGLMQDIIGLLKENSIPHQDKFMSALGKIEKQVGRGVEMMTQFNRFAHSMDEAWAQVDVEEVMEQVVFLMQRVARLKQVRLSSESPPKNQTLYTNPVRLILALSGCIDYCLNKAAPGTIILQAEKVGQELAFRIMVDQGPKETSMDESFFIDLQDLEEPLGVLDGELRPLKAPGRVGITLVLPLKKVPV
jgi:C4-dicarboxylate-specific signal transduction histidine kinase